MPSNPTNPEITPELSAERLEGTFPGDLTEIGDGHVQGRLKVDRRHLHPQGFVHAGAWVGLADTVAAWGTLRHLSPGAGFPPTELKITVLPWASEGDRLEAIGEPLHVGSRTQVWQVKVFREQRLVANF